MNEAKPYACPTCEAEYKVVRVEAKATMREGRLICRKCGGPLHAREGRYVLKYFLVGGSQRHPLRGRSQK
jgi:transcription elongation factor Elf1